MKGSERPDANYINRELSWLDFNERVLALAEDGFTPLLERAKFLAIFARNLDEFYQVRVAGSRRQIEAGFSRRSPDGMSPEQQLRAIADKIRPMVERHAKLFKDEVWPGLCKEDVKILRWRDLEESQRRELDRVFLRGVFPVLTPLAVGPAHPFPYISNLSLNLAVLVRDPERDRSMFARVKVPPILPRFIELASKHAFVPVEDAIAANLDKLFPGMEILEHHAFRVTRDADIELDDEEAQDLLSALETEIERRRFSPAVRLEIESGMSQRVLELLVTELQIESRDLHELPGPLGLASLWELYDLDRPDLKDEPFYAPSHPSFSEDEDGHIFSVIARRDVLVHHPYQSFRSTVQRFVKDAAGDPDVLAIKQTLYRTSGESPIVNSLIKAARSGKQVVVLVEIKARFDEVANIKWARALEKSGCHVVYGVVGLKTHCKFCLVVRREGNELRRYVHIGTGNYNPKTAESYEDLGLFTADPKIGEDVSDLFNYLTGYSRHTTYQALIVSPNATRDRLLEMVAREAALSSAEQPGRIIMKMNGLTDERVIDALYAASQQSVEIDLIVRDSCALRPGVEGLSDNIRVRSILGRFLEHSRIFYFHNHAEPEVLIGSADLMHRNLDRRVEALVRVQSPDACHRLKMVLELALQDNSGAWVLSPEGTWHRVQPNEQEPIRHLQDELMRESAHHA
jgi:polyphosphate kinase